MAVDTSDCSDPNILLKHTFLTVIYDLFHFAAFVVEFCLRVFLFLALHLVHTHFFTKIATKCSSFLQSISNWLHKGYHKIQTLLSIQDPTKTLPTRHLTTQIVISALRHASSHRRSNFRRIRHLSWLGGSIGFWKTKFDIHVIGTKKDLQCEDRWIDIKPEFEVDLEEDDGIDREMLKGRRKLHALMFRYKSSGQSREAKKLMLYIHGGGYCLLSSKSHSNWTAKVAEQGVDVLSIDYRLAPEFPFPAAIHDCFAVYQYILQELRVEPQNILLGGDSGGGGLCMALVQVLHRVSAPFPAGIYMISPWVDLERESPSILDYQIHDFLAVLTHKRLNVPKLYGGKRYSNLEEFIEMDLVSPGRSKSLPPNLPPILIQASPHEQLYNSISNFFLNLVRSSPQCPVTLELYEDMMHTFQVFGEFLPLHPEVDIYGISMGRMKKWLEALDGSDELEEQNEGELIRTDSGISTEEKSEGKKFRIVLRHGEEIEREEFCCRHSDK
ncbi:Alpha/Beta hydrolase protein [Paraphysoderma sedebokerense]|nr:Alpha/Beta hydrolase protein [Paraphysoderma sedebokerense]